MSLKPRLLTAEGLERLTKELHYLETEEREKIADRLQQAHEDGQDADFVENAALESARMDQSYLEARISEIKETLANYKLIEEEDNGPHDTIRIGDWFTVVEEGYDDEEKYQMVGAVEADPEKGRISNESPLGTALLGKKVGDVVQISAPNGILSFRVVRIE